MAKCSFRLTDMPLGESFLALDPRLLCTSLLLPKVCDLSHARLYIHQVLCSCKNQYEVFATLCSILDV